MFIVFGILLPIVLFLVSIPLQSYLYLVKTSLRIQEMQESKVGNLVLKKTLGFSRGTDTFMSKFGLSKRKGIENKQLRNLTLKAKKLLVSSLSALVSLIRSVSMVLMTTVMSFGMMSLPIILALFMASSSILLFIGNKDSSISYGDLVTNDNIVQETITSNNTGWVGSVETMANWYLASIDTYCGNYENKMDGSRGYYACDLLGGENVGDDCSSFVYACLIYGGYIDGSPSSAPSSSSYLSSGSMVSKLQDAGFEQITIGSDTTFQAGDILARSGHVEMVVAVNEDGTYNTFGWGKIQSSYPSSSNVSNLTTKYSYAYRLSK